MSVQASPALDLDEIVSCILQWLPPVSLFRARLVCRKWNKIVLSQPTKIRKPCCYHCCHGENKHVVCRLFDPSLSFWTRVSCPTSLTRRAKLCLIESGGNSGLVAFCEYDMSSYNFRGNLTVPHFWVGNPLTNTWKFIRGCEGLVDPFNVPIPISSLHFLVSEGPPICYKIVAFSSLFDRTYGLRTLIYDSTTQEWKPGAAPYLGMDSDLAGSATHNECIYFVGRQTNTGMSHIVSYSPLHDRFDVLAQAPERDLRPNGLVLLEDNQVPVLVVYRKSRHRSVRFYKFQEDMQGWALRKTSKLDALKEGLVMSNGMVFSFSGKAEHLYVATDWDMCSVLLYEADKHACRFLPRPSSLKGEGQNVLNGLMGQICSFLPRFDMQP